MILAKVCLGAGRRCASVSLGAAHLKRGDLIVVRTEEGLTLGEILDMFPGIEAHTVPGNLAQLERLATPEDLAQVEKNRALEERAFEFCRERIDLRQLPIHLVQVVVLFDASKIIFYFTAPGRVDFRELVKDLVQEFRCRIELRQIGVRHRAKMLGGLGICGRTLCCGTFLRDFDPVSVRMAKEQQLSLNPGKISGVCGRLMCCLTYEYPIYQELKKQFPRVGKHLKLPEGDAKIIRYNLVRQTVTVEMPGGTEKEISLGQILQSGPGPDAPEEMKSEK